MEIEFNIFNEKYEICGFSRNKNYFLNSYSFLRKSRHSFRVKKLNSWSYEVKFLKW